MTKRKAVNPKIREIGLPVILIFVVIALIIILGAFWNQGNMITDATPDVIVSDPIIVEESVEEVVEGEEGEDVAEEGEVVEEGEEEEVVE